MSGIRAGLRAAALAIAALLPLASCGNSRPEISAVEWRIEARPDAQGKSYESLSAFASLKHDDGVDSIDELLIVDDDAAIAWRLTKDDWEKSTDGADTWIGASALTTQDFSSPPRGSYRFVAIDSAGQKAEKGFKVEGSFPGRAPPALSVSGGKLSALSQWPETLAVVYDGVGDFIASAPAPKQASSPEELFGDSAGGRAVEAAAYGYDPELRMGSFSKRQRLR